MIISNLLPLVMSIGNAVSCPIPSSGYEYAFPVTISSSFAYGSVQIAGDGYPIYSFVGDFQLNAYVFSNSDNIGNVNVVNNFYVLNYNCPCKVFDISATLIDDVTFSGVYSNWYRSLSNNDVFTFGIDFSDDKVEAYAYLKYNTAVVSTSNTYLCGDYSNNVVSSSLSFTFEDVINAFRHEYNVYNAGYSVGLDEGTNTDAGINSIFGGILDIGLIPINIFLAIFNFEILGINLTGFFTAILTTCLVVIMVRTFLGGKSGD